MDERDKPQADIIMRGGAASGVVYPWLVSELARHYRFRTIGGASAGAIAAGVMAAAQYGVLNKNPQAFGSTIRPIPEWLAEAGEGGTRLRRLFRASKGLEPLERLRDSAIELGTLSGILFAEAGERLDARTVPALLVASCLVALAVGLALRPSLEAGGWGAFATAAALLALAAVLAFGAIALLVGWHVYTRFFAQKAWTAFRAAGFGICGGTEPERWRAWAVAVAHANQKNCRKVEAPGDHLADWLHGRIQEAAGLCLCRPITMGHLWAGKSPVSDISAWSRPREIDLVLTATNLSHQIPHRFPFVEKPGMWLYFDCEELERVLPMPVVDAMIAATEKAMAEHRGSNDKTRHALAGLLKLEQAGKTYWRLPRPEQLPVLLGVRMSLSFPVLLAPVRLWAWDRSDGMSEQATPDDPPVLRPCWFSDGGITSNFPVTMFDSLLPARPTFCINLANLPPGESPATRIELDVSDRKRIAPEWRTDLDGGGLGRFAGSIVDTARNGHENDLQTMPTCRNRIVTIRLDPEQEGGLNLDMPPEVIGRMAGYGEEAAKALLAAYPPDGEGSASAWSAHRTLRLRKSLAALESLLVAFDSGWNAPARGTPPWRLAFEDLAKGSIDRPGRRHVAQRLVGRWTRLASLVAAATRRPEASFFDGARNLDDPTSLNRIGQAPRPRMGLKLSPTGSQDPLGD